MINKQKKSGLGIRAGGGDQAGPEKYLRGVLGGSEAPPPVDQPPATQVNEGEAPLWESAKAPGGNRLVPKTWHLPEELAYRFDSFIHQKCPPGTRGVKVVRQILDEFLKSHGF